MKRQKKQFLGIAATFAIVLVTTGVAAAGPDCSNPKFADHVQCASDPQPDPTTTTAPRQGVSCAGDTDPMYATDGIVEILAGGSANWCDDIPNGPNGTRFGFDFSVSPPNGEVRAGFVLGIRNSIPGDWCGGLWSLFDADGSPMVTDVSGNALSPTRIGDGWYAILEIEEQFAPDGNCTADGTLLWYDDNPEWVLTLGSGAGKPFKGDEAVSVTWALLDPSGS